MACEMNEENNEENKEKKTRVLLNSWTLHDLKKRNDDIARKNQILDYCIQPNFQIVKKVIMNSDNFYNLAVPFDGKEMDYCTFTVPLFRDKQWFWMQLTGND